ncbi:MAG: hypothetical protein IPG30_13525 [Chitinophagaceae bacterium]|nr:hypothetical protein [Chitinophagaceae bacterium]
MIQIIKISPIIFNVEVRVTLSKGCSLRAGIADGGEFYIRPLGTAARLFDKVKY